MKNLYAIRQKIRNNPICRLESPAEVAVAGELGLKIDVNQATVDDWLRLPGLSIRQARSLVELTDMGVQLLSLEDLAAALSVSMTQVKLWEPVLYFGYYDPESLTITSKVNPNTASKTELLEVPGINSDLAAKIITNRQENGKYTNLAAFKRRLDLNSEFVAQLLHYLRF